MLLVLLARLLLAGVFVASGVGKLRDRAGARRAAEDFGLPGGLVGPIAVALPFVELACAVLLVVADPGATAGAIASLLLLAAFTLTIAVNLLSGRQVDCHCFGQLSGGRTSWRTVGRNGALLVLAAVPLARAGDLPSVPGQLADYSGRELGLGLLLAALTAAVVALGVFCRTLLVQYGSVLLRLEALEARAPVQYRPAPEFDLPDLDGGRTTLEELVGQERPVLLAFVSPTCGICSELLPDLAQWQAAGEVTVAVVSDGTVEQNRDKLDGSPLRLLRQDGRAVTEAYGVSGTPAAVLIGNDGLIAGDPAYGVDPIRQLYAATQQAVSPDEPALHQIGRRPFGVGDELPDLPVQLNGQEVSVRTVEDGVLLFWNTSCGFCSAISADVAELEQSAPVTLVPISETDDLRRSGLRSAVAHDVAFAVGDALQVPGTPAAVRVLGGRLDSDIAVGGPEVLALLRSSNDHSV
jgi:methylamine dehydrogenase accessory protein MauD